MTYKQKGTNRREQRNSESVKVLHNGDGAGVPGLFMKRTCSQLTPPIKIYKLQTCAKLCRLARPDSWL